MCCGCWKEQGSPQIINEKTMAAQDLIEKVYEYNGAGGLLHIVLDDWNLEDSHVSHCVHNIDHPPDYCDDPPEAIAAYRQCAVAFQAMTVEERASALGIHSGCFTT